MNYYLLATEIVSEPEKGYLFTKVQLDFLKDIVNALSPEERLFLRSYHPESADRKAVIAKLKRRPELVLVLELGRFSTQDLIDSLVYCLAGNTHRIVKEDEESYSLAFDASDEVLDKADYDIIDFLGAKISHGAPKITHGRCVDSAFESVNSIYEKLLSQRNQKIEDACWLDFDRSYYWEIFQNGAATNNMLLQYYISQDRNNLVVRFGENWCNKVESYFKFWLGEDYQSYSDSSDF